MKSAFYDLRTILRIRKYFLAYQRKLLRFLFTPLQLPNSITAILYFIMYLKTSSKSFNRCRMQLPDWLHAQGSVITSLPSSPIFTGYLFLNELNSRFGYLPSKLCISNLQPTFKTLSPATKSHYGSCRYLPSGSLRSSSTLSLNPVSFNLTTYWSRAFSVSAVPDDISSCENRSLFKHKLKTYVLKNFYFSH